MAEITKKAPTRRTKGTGSIIERDTQLYARITWQTTEGKRRSRERKAKSRKHAEQLIRDMLNDLDARGSAGFEAERATFANIAERFKKKKLVAPEYSGDTRIKGMRSWKHALSLLKPLLAYFGHRILRSITYEDLVSYREHRLTIITMRGKQRSLANINRELSLLRSIFNYAKRSNLIARSPFEAGEGLISLAGEVRRDRLISREEEQKLLDACVGRRAHLRRIIIAAIDTGLRKGELLQLIWSDVDFEAGVISVRSTTTKTRRPRVIGLTARLSQELKQLWETSKQYPTAFIFSGIKDCKRSFRSACKAAGIADFHFHDLRHVATTRMVKAGLPPAQVMKITGHTKFETFSRYLNVDKQGAQEAAARLDALNESEAIQPSNELSN